MECDFDDAYNYYYDDDEEKKRKSSSDDTFFLPIFPSSIGHRKEKIIWKRGSRVEERQSDYNKIIVAIM